MRTSGNKRLATQLEDMSLIPRIHLQTCMTQWQEIVTLVIGEQIQVNPCGSLANTSYLVSKLHENESVCIKKEDKTKIRYICSENHHSRLTRDLNICGHSHMCAHPYS